MINKINDLNFIIKDLLTWATTTPTDSVINIYTPALAFELPRYDITSRVRICHFLAQILHESGELRYTEELASGADYEGRKDLGNIYPGDGIKYKGRGLIQLTGRFNYRDAGQALGYDYESNPYLVAQLPHSLLVSCWFWQSRGLNVLADKGDLAGITLRINGGYNGFNNRWRYLNRLMTRWDLISK